MGPTRKTETEIVTHFRASIETVILWTYLWLANNFHHLFPRRDFGQAANFAPFQVGWQAVISTSLHIESYQIHAMAFICALEESVRELNEIRTRIFYCSHLDVLKGFIYLFWKTRVESLDSLSG